MTAVTVARTFEDLFRDYHSVIVTAVFNRLNDLGDAEDVTADVFAGGLHVYDHATVGTAIVAGANVPFTVWVDPAVRAAIAHDRRGRVGGDRARERDPRRSHRPVALES